MGGISLQSDYEENDGYDEVQLLIENVHHHGAQLYFDGKAVGYTEGVLRLVREEHQYMADYIMGDDGNIEQIRFNKISTS
jgi:hypothetical protein